MKESDRGMFENEWESAFEGAEMAPSETVWSKVEVAVANNEGKNYKRSLLFFKLLAAASVSFAMSIGGWQLYENYYNQENLFEVTADQQLDISTQTEDEIKEKQPLIAQERESENERNENETPNSNSNDNDDLGLDKIAGNEEKGTTKMTLAHKTLLALNKDNSIDNVANNDKNEASDNETFVAQNESSSPDKLDYLGVDFFEVNGELVEPKMVPWLSNIPSRKSDDFKGLWAGVGMSAGSFNSNSSSASSANSLSEGFLNSDVGQVSTNNVSYNESNGNAYSFGLNVGTQISKRFVLMSGLNYVQQSNTSNSNIVALNTEGFSAVDRNTSLSSEASYAYTDSYKISNTYELLSVPVQAGYILLDRKFNILLLSGVSNDIFLRQKITDESGRAQSVENNGSDNGYSTYSLSGLIGSEFSYDIGENYMLSLQPQIRQTINSFTPEGSKPTYFEVGFKFKYIIK
ncbi:hypothetical protein [Fulvivirga lutimaris]|uniref:hypothetical protein n=1 Tax=Fulvivirga lutimaris TaxID=1819566 RepID=UPI0012BBF83E|nr:hypothetical protein [Fulvivirga lutimaris]MTI40850.1 hypothetical protein [Fulvivirga lutimaris]